MRSSIIFLFFLLKQQQQQQQNFQTKMSKYDSLVRAVELQTLPKELSSLQWPIFCALKISGFKKWKHDFLSPYPLSKPPLFLSLGPIAVSYGILQNAKVSQKLKFANV